EAARTGKEIEQDEEAKEGFSSLLDKRVEKEDEKKESPQTGEELQKKADELARDEQKQAAETDRKEAESHREVRQHNREQTVKEAERRGWTGPTPVIGLSVVSAAAPREITVGVTSQDKTRAEDDGTQAVEIRPGEAKVDPTLLAGLRTAGLKQPLIGLADPRLAGTQPNLPDWHQGPIQGGTSFVWSSGPAHQKLEWSEGRTLLESAAGTMIQTLERKGNQTFARLSRRDNPLNTRFDLREEP
ncbi:MAG: hypothetical protein KC910_24430, partial [Candidatus Eremiobacteraeota bacterium]|nr:hypothetical protein [Candidatus Eremiobacteraeota bacterium]